MNYLRITSILLFLAVSVPFSSEAGHVKVGVEVSDTPSKDYEAFSSLNRTKRRVNDEDVENGSRLERGVAENGAGHDKNEETPGVHVVSWRWDHVGVFITITLFIVLSGLAKVGTCPVSRFGNGISEVKGAFFVILAFHHAHFISSRVPESW